VNEARRSARKSAKSTGTAGTAGVEVKDLDQQVRAVLKSLERLGSKRCPKDWNGKTRAAQKITKKARKS